MVIFGFSHWDPLMRPEPWAPWSLTWLSRHPRLSRRWLDLKIPKHPGYPAGNEHTALAPFIFWEEDFPYAIGWVARVIRWIMTRPFWDLRQTRWCMREFFFSKWPDNIPCALPSFILIIRCLQDYTYESLKKLPPSQDAVSSPPVNYEPFLS